MSTWRRGWTCPRSYFFAAVFLAVRLLRSCWRGILGGRPIAALYLWEDDEVDGGDNGAICRVKGPK